MVVVLQTEATRVELLSKNGDQAAAKEFSERPVVQRSLDDAQLSALYAEFAGEDRYLAEVGIADYAQGLAEEDSA